jgi:hypothetical protein
LAVPIIHDFCHAEYAQTAPLKRNQYRSLDIRERAMQRPTIGLARDVNVYLQIIEAMSIGPRKFNGRMGENSNKQQE